MLVGEGHQCSARIGYCRATRLRYKPCVLPCQDRSKKTWQRCGRRVFAQFANFDLLNRTIKVELLQKCPR